MGVGRSSQGQMNDDDLHRLRQDLFPDYPDGLNIKSLVKDPVCTLLFPGEGSLFIPCVRFSCLRACFAFSTVIADCLWSVYIAMTD